MHLTWTDNAKPVDIPSPISAPMNSRVSLGNAIGCTTSLYNTENRETPSKVKILRPYRAIKAMLRAVS